MMLARKENATMPAYAIDDQYGDVIVSDLGPHEVRARAQEIANMYDEPVFWYVNDGSGIVSTRVDPE